MAAIARVGFVELKPSRPKSVIPLSVCPKLHHAGGFVLLEKLMDLVCRRLPGPLPAHREGFGQDPERIQLEASVSVRP